MSRLPPKIGLALAIDIDKRLTEVSQNCRVVAARLKTVQIIRYPRRNTATGTYGPLRSLRRWFTVANVITIGVTEGAIMATIMMDHITNMVRNPGTFHRTPADIQ